MRVRYICCLLFMLLCCMGMAQSVYSNRLLGKNMRSLQVILEGDTMGNPVIHQGTDDKVDVSFDEMSHRPHSYSYRIKHCEADWKLSKGINEIDFLKGFQENKIESYYQSINTTFEYTHYYFQIPNDNVELLLSGNYIAEIFDSDNPDSIVATACFSVNEDLATAEGSVSSKTEYGVNNQYQQLGFSIDGSQLQVTDPSEQIKLVVFQNGRKDNMVTGLKPTYTQGSKLIYENNNRLIFEGGTEFPRIDFSHIHYFSGQISHITFAHPYYHVEVNPGEDISHHDYQFDNDVDGRYKVHGQDVWSEKEIDYSIVHFSFKASDPWLDGSLYVAGYFNDNYLDKNNKMTYNFDTHQYELVLVLKNGGYNYQYLFVPSGQTKATTSRAMGNHWQTENEYDIYIYYRPFGSQYDRLVGVTTLKSGGSGN